jgi:hypothetical protein
VSPLAQYAQRVDALSNNLRDKGIRGAKLFGSVLALD